MTVCGCSPGKIPQCPECGALLETNLPRGKPAWYHCPDCCLDFEVDLWGRPIPRRRK